MGQGYYYTLSAIAQSFAAIIALDAIFVIFKLKNIEDTIEALFAQARELIVRDGTGDVHDKISIGICEREANKLTKEELLDWLQKGKIESHRSEIESKKIALNSAMNKICQHRRRTMNWFHIALMLNAVTIFVSLVFLPWGSVCHPNFHYAVIIPILILSCITLISTIHAIAITIGYRGFAFMNSVLGYLSKSSWLQKCANKLLGTELPN